MHGDVEEPAIGDDLSGLVAVRAERSVSGAEGPSWYARSPEADQSSFAPPAPTSPWPTRKRFEPTGRMTRRPCVDRGGEVSLALLAVIVVPAVIAVIAIVQNVGAIRTFLANLPTHKIPLPPDWVARIPAVGERASATWAQVSAGGLPGLATKFEPYMKSVATWTAGEFESVGAFLAQFLLTVAITAIMYAGGEKTVAGLQAFLRRLAGQAGVSALDLAGGAIRGVAMGVVGTAIVQTVFGAVGLAIVGVPFIAVLTLIMLVLCVAQIGTAPVLVLATIWTFKTHGVGWGIFMAAWTVIDSMLNNVIRPMLIKKGADLPLLLIMAGVLGGLLTFGMIGLFAGPVLLAVSYTLLEAWVKGGWLGGKRQAVKSVES